MRKKVFLTAIASLLLFVGIWGCSSDEPISDEPIEYSDEMCITECITGTILDIELDKERLQDYDPEFVKDSKKYVFIEVVNMSKEDEQYDYIKAVVVPKKEFPLKQYQSGDIISFRIVEVKSTYPQNYIGYNRCTAYICAIKLCK